MSTYSLNRVDPGGPDAKCLIRQLQEHGVADRQIAKDCGCCVEDLQAILNCGKVADTKMTTTLARRFANRTAAYGPYLRENQRAIALINQLLDLGLTECQVAIAVGVGAPYISQILRGRAQASNKLSLRLAALHRERSIAMVCRAAEMRSAPVQLNAACKSPDAQLETVEREQIRIAIQKAVLGRFVADSCERIQLPKGLPAVVVQLDDDLQIIAFDRGQCRDAEANPVAHEYEAVAYWCLEKAKESRRKAGESARAKGRPKKWG
jgi:hypothetical protein